MMCYKDKSFCNLKDCKFFNECDRALTEKVKKDAEKWWGDKNAPICIADFSKDCYKKEKK